MLRNSGGISSEAVKAKTGRDWDEWFAILDDAGAAGKKHKDIVGILAAHGGISSWWQQSVAVAYEQERGLREKHEKPRGYEISKSKTIYAKSEDLHEAFASEQERSEWLEEVGVEIRTSRPPESLRLNWPGGTFVEVRLYEKGEKTQVVVQHSKLSDSDSAARMKVYWGEKLERLASHVGAPTD